VNAEGEELLKVYIKGVCGPAVATEFKLPLLTGSDRTSLISPRKKKKELTTAEMALATAASLQGRLRAKNRRGGRGGEKQQGDGEEPQHHHNTKPEQYGPRVAGKWHQ
jgi:hypothetical protein